MRPYVHGYSEREAQRLHDQCAILEDLLHSDTAYPPGSTVLEAGCGVGAQTVILAKRNPQARIVSIDISADSLGEARDRTDRLGITNVQLQQADIMDMPFGKERFDHVFVCFVLEHLEEPLRALQGLKKVLREGGTITVIEGDHGSCFWHPQTAESLAAWQSLITTQSKLNHDPLVGRRLYPLLEQAGFEVDNVSPRWVYADAANPSLLDGMVNRIIVPMVETARERALQLRLMDQPSWDKGIADLRRTGVPPDAAFFYTWFKGSAVKPKRVP